MFFQLTVELLRLYSNEEMDRDEKIAKTDELLDRRETVMKQIQAPSTDEEKELLKKCFQLNDKLSELMTTEKLLIQKDIKNLSMKKETTNKYANPYESFPSDGVFYDKKN